jgi:LacI family transcriptional regulator
MMDADWVGIDNRAAGATAAHSCLGSSSDNGPLIMVISESMQSRDSLERRLGFDDEINLNFPHLRACPPSKPYGNDVRAEEIIAASLNSNPDTVGIYVVTTEARTPRLRRLKSTQ